jgi:membrane-associated phospholipid phosphatase
MKKQISRFFRFLFCQEKKPVRGLFAAEWVVLGYMVLTLLFIFFTWTKLSDPSEMVFGRLRIAVTTAALWWVYRLLPCRFTRMARITLQLSLLSWWYPDTFDMNRILPNLDPIFATLDQSWFGCQPALLFSEKITHPFFSELMYLGYSSYFMLILCVTLFYFFRRYEEFQRCGFIITGAFFLYYVVFILLPVTGPQFYYVAAGVENIRNGVFPAVGDYFLHHDEMMTPPGYAGGPFYQLVAAAHAAGERPTAAFPSSHVGITLVLLYLAIHSRNRWLTATVGFFFTIMCFSTVYIRAHYLVDVFGGIVSATVFYFTLYYITRIKRLE